MNSSIQHLLDHAKDGDKSAINRLMECKRNYLRHIVGTRLDRKIRRRIDISDVIQEILVFANRRLQHYLRKPELPFEYWLKRIANDKIVDAYRQHRNAHRRSVDREHFLDKKDCSNTSFVQQLPEPNLTPATHAVKKEITAQVENAVNQLSAADREIIILRHFQFLSNQESARRLGLTSATASVRYVRALKKLRQILAAENPETI